MNLIFRVLGEKDSIFRFSVVLEFLSILIK